MPSAPSTRQSTSFSGRGGEEDEHAGGIGAELLGEEVRAHYVALGLRHLGAFGDHHALGEEAARRLAVGDEADVAHHLGEEARVDEVQDGVLDAADVLIDLEPVGDLRRVERLGGIVRVAVAIEIPGAVDEGVHGIGFPAGGGAAHRARHVDELGDVFERGASGAGDLDAVGQNHGELVFGYRDDAALGAVDDGDRRAPVALARDAPVLEAVGDGGFAEALALGVSGHLAARFGAG